MKKRAGTRENLILVRSFLSAFRSDLLDRLRLSPPGAIGQ